MGNNVGNTVCVWATVCAAVSAAERYRPAVCGGVMHQIRVPSLSVTLRPGPIFAGKLFCREHLRFVVKIMSFQVELLAFS